MKLPPSGRPLAKRTSFGGKVDGETPKTNAKSKTSGGGEVAKANAPVGVPTQFDASGHEATAVKVAGTEEQKAPSAALSQSARIMSPHLLFQEFEKKAEPAATPAKSQNEMSDAELLQSLLDTPVRLSSKLSEADDSMLVAKLPAERKTAAGMVRYGHDDGKLTIEGSPKDGGKAEVVHRTMGLGAAAQFSVAFDAAMAATFPRFSTQEPPEMWVALAGAERAAAMALKVDEGSRSPFDAAKVLRSFLPKATPIVATKTIMDQIQQMAGLANKVLDGNPNENLVDLEDQALKAKGSSLLNEVLKEHDRKTGARSLLDDVIDQPVKPAPLPDDDSAVVATVNGMDVTAGEIREKAFRDQKAVAFQIPGFADEHGSQRTLNMQVEKRGKKLEWSFHGVVGDRSRIVSGDFSAEGIEKLKSAVEKQPRYDMVPYKTKVPRFSPRLVDAAVAGLEADRDRMEEMAKERGGVPVSEVFPHLA